MVIAGVIGAVTSLETMECPDSSWIAATSATAVDDVLAALQLGAVESDVAGVSVVRVVTSSSESVAGELGCVVVVVVEMTVAGEGKVAPKSSLRLRNNFMVAIESSTLESEVLTIRLGCQAVGTVVPSGWNG